MTQGPGRRTFRAVATVSVLLFVGACAPAAEEIADPGEVEASEGTGASGGPSAEWVLRTVRTFTLERMFAEQDPDPAAVHAGDRPGDVLTEAGVLVEDGEGTRVETDPELWSPSLGEGLSGDGPLLQEVDQALADLLRENGVSWCGPEVPGDTFVDSYPALEAGAFDTHEEYLEDIADYVDCGEDPS
ncbi:hypothetical protein SAMN05421803_13721 [Nocardiopsis flavescens]|uniref:Uncharacterized protein n=1 Tax=Nocardiopsis flavescens TaxID=758803 RepID=A0A1M6VU55_9ACTN|nr:hypothetical protein SAMN05421803_13721 [Nocardiopsis flavescens]